MDHQVCQSIASLGCSAECGGSSLRSACFCIGILLGGSLAYGCISNSTSHRVGSETWVVSSKPGFFFAHRRVGFAALPNLPGMNPEDQPLGPLPAAVGMAFLEQAAEDDSEEASRRARSSNNSPQNLPYVARKKRIPPITPMPTESSTSTAEPGQIPTSRPASMRNPSRQSSVSSVDTAFDVNDKVSLRKAHDNLNARLAPFWSSVLPSRRVLFDIYASPPSSKSYDASTAPEDTEKDDDEALDKRAPTSDPLHSFEFYTDSNGHFSQVVVIPWEKLCTTPSTVEAVFNSTAEGGQTGGSHPLIGWKLMLRSRLDYEVLPVAESDMSYRQRIRRAISSYGVDATDGPVERSGGGPTPTAAEETMAKLSLNTPGEPQVIEWTTIRVGSAAGVHIISDLVSPTRRSQLA
jgi:hypothetical protein